MNCSSNHMKSKISTVIVDSLRILIGEPSTEILFSCMKHIDNIEPEACYEDPEGFISSLRENLGSNLAYTAEVLIMKRLCIEFSMNIDDNRSLTDLIEKIRSH